MAKKRFNWLWKQTEPEETGLTVLDREIEDDYGWSRKYGEEKKQGMFSWDEYTKSGDTWSYEKYKPATLSYSYVEQMANIIASQHNVNLQVGKYWGIDLETKTLTYNPMQLMFGTKAELLGTLLHEVGKIKLSTPYKKLKAQTKSDWLEKYTTSAYEVAALYDDFRVDNTMIEAYPSAPEIYESQTPVLEIIIKDYGRRAMAQRANLILKMEKFQQELNHHVIQVGETEFQGIYRQMFNVPAPVATSTEWNKLVKTEMERIKRESILPEYIAHVIRGGYGVDMKIYGTNETIMFQEKTAPAIYSSVTETNTEGVLSRMETEVFPVIEKLLEDDQYGSKQLQQCFGQGVAEAMAHLARVSAMGNPEAMDAKEKGQPTVRGGIGRDTNHIPKEWAIGDYQSLKESVSSEIRSLYAKMLNLRRKENTTRYENNQRRGKLNSKSLYKFATGSDRLFKKKFNNTDTIRSFVFSILVDTSGSMNGQRIIHATRALILLSEVFTKLDMPFEIIHFDDRAEVTKSFDEKYDKSVQNDVVARSQMDGGGTILESALDKTKIKKRPELNRVMVILTDGDVGDHQALDAKYFDKYRDQGIRVIPIGIEVGEHITRLAHGSGINVDMSSEIPNVFYNMLRGLISKASHIKI